MAIAVRTLEKQIKMLEQMPLKYEIPMPERPPASMKTNIDPESMEDRFMFQQIFIGIDNMIDMHIRAIIELFGMTVLERYLLNSLKMRQNILKGKGWLCIRAVSWRHGRKIYASATIKKDK